MSYIDVYILQNVPSSNINRDDTGNPKTNQYGGRLRSRVSSQAWKRAMREMFPEYLNADELGVRTKMALSLISERIAEQREDLSDKSDELAKISLNAIGIKTEETKRKGSDLGSETTGYLIFIATSEINALADLAISWNDDEKIKYEKKGVKISNAMKREAQSIFIGPQAIDIALFGRMLADAPDLNTDAAAQVAHATSVDQIVPEYDYFTAGDDCAAADNVGAAMLDTVGFNSSTLYRYANINVNSLREQVGDDKAAVAGIAAFIETFVRSMPTGKQNTFANRTLPSACVVMVREGQPINAVEAFENPVRPTDDASITMLAEERLGKYLDRLRTVYGEVPQKSWVVCMDETSALLNVGEVLSLPQMREAVSEYFTTEFEGRD